VAVLGQGDEVFQEGGARFGVRQKRVVAQRFCRQLHIATRAVLKVQADEVDDAVFGLLDFRAQILAAKIARDLNHAFGRFGFNSRQLRSRNDAVLHAILQGFFEEGAGIVEADGHKYSS
jgi:hypothetical protein